MRFGASVAAYDGRRGDLSEEIRNLRDVVDFFHVDITESSIPHEELNRCYGDAQVEYHLMAPDLDAPWAKTISAAGGSSIVFHVEAMRDLNHFHHQVRDIRDEGLAVGLAVNPDTPVASVAPLIEAVDMIQLMLVTPGRSGQEMQKHALEKIPCVKSYRPNVPIQLDGGVNLDTVRDCLAADSCVVGSFLFNAPSPRDALAHLRQFSRTRD